MEHIKNPLNPVRTESSPWRRLWRGAGLLLTFLCLLLIGTILILRWVNPPVSAFVLQEDWMELETERYNLREPWVEYEDLPEHLKWAVVAAEDQRFWEHWGLDLIAIEDALEERRAGTRERGASTISQQVAKNLFLTPTPSFIRKGVEAGIAILIELFWTKERILEVYLNIAEFGPGLFGVGKASESNFGIHASQLNPDQSARLAAVLPSPKRMRVEPPSNYTQERSRWILRQMRQLSGIRFGPEPSPEEVSEPKMMDLEDEVPERELPDSNDRAVDSDLPDSVDGLEPPESDTGSTDTLREHSDPEL